MSSKCLYCINQSISKARVKLVVYKTALRHSRKLRAVWIASSLRAWCTTQCNQ